MKKIDSIFSVGLIKILIAVIGMIFLSLGCKTTSEGNLEVNSADGGGINWGMTFINDAPQSMPSVEELTRGADLIVKAEVVSSRPVNLKFNNVTYYQLSLLKIREIIKGSSSSEVISVYARENNVPAKYMSAYELCDEVLVFLKKDKGLYFTYGNAYGQMSIAGGRITNWRKIERGKVEDNIIIPYNEAKQLIIITLYVNSLNKKDKE
ncbi:MAG: hypothetical protein P9M01_02075 [Candidatus Kappaea frigidicola]|nr:hypothetical protein [Candidatus Kappaea frigidicola]